MNESIETMCSALDDRRRWLQPENAVLVYDEEKNSFSLRNGEQGTKMIFSEVLAAAEEAHGRESFGT